MDKSFGMNGAVDGSSMETGLLLEGPVHARVVISEESNAVRADSTHRLEKCCVSE